MPQSPPSSPFSSQGGLLGEKKRTRSTLPNVHWKLKFFKSYASFCWCMLLIVYTLIVFVFLDSVTVDAATLQETNAFKSYLGQAKHVDNDYFENAEKWKRTQVRFLTKVKQDEEAGVHTDTNDYDEDELKPSVGIAANDFHIIELEPENSDQNRNGAKLPAETLRIHLMRKASVVSPQLRVVVKENGQEQIWNPLKNNSEKVEENNCHFVGHVTGVATPTKVKNASTAKDYATNKTASEGLAVFSACTPSKGFSGLIIMKDGRQWYIEPLSDSFHHHRRQKREASSETGYDALDHVLLPHNHLANHLAAHISDVLHVPLPQLEEAARLAAADAEARRTTRNVVGGPSSSLGGWDDDDSSFESLQGESSILTPFFYRATLPFFARTNDYKATHARKVASSSPSKKSNNGRGSSSSVQTTLLTPLEKGSIRTFTTSTTSTTSSTTVKQTASSSVSSASVENLSVQTKPLPRVVEIAVFTDEDLYNKMKSKFSADTTAQLKEYATAMVNMMDVMYQHSSLGVDLRFRLVYLEVMKKKPTPLKTHGGRAKAYLSSFCDYAGEKNVNSAQWDHALLLTGIDLHEEGIKTTAGLAWAGTMCFRYYSCSISEGLNFASAYITTHEIGHSLGMEHDGVGISESCDSTKYIMSPTTGPGKVTWSTCSSSNLQDFINYGTSELRGKTGKGNFMISRPICLEELVTTRGKKSFDVGGISSSSSGDAILETDSDLKLPGEKYDANFQCTLGMGSIYKPHFERHRPPFDNICWILYCGNGTHAISTHPALEGTPCDRKKYCRAGQCVKRPDTAN